MKDWQQNVIRSSAAFKERFGDAFGSITELREKATAAAEAQTVAETALSLAESKLSVLQSAGTASAAELAAAQEAVAAAEARVSTTAHAAADAQDALSIAETKASAKNSANFFDDLAASIKGAATSALSFTKALLTNPVTYAVAGFAAFIGILYAQATAFDRAKESAENSLSAYQETQSNIESLNGQIKETSSRIEELQALKDAGTITLAEESELNQLQRENELLNQQIKLLEQRTSTEAAEAAKDAREALGKETFKPHIESDNYSALSNVQNGFMSESSKTDIISATKEDLETLKQLKASYQEIYSDWDSAAEGSKEKDYYKDKLDSKKEDIDKFKGYVSDNLTEINNLAEGLDPIKDSALLDSIHSLNTAFTSLDLSPVEQAKAQLDSFFDGSTKGNAISDAILDMVKNGDSATEAIQKLGLSLDDLGLNSSQGEYLNKYFDDLAKSAQEASEAVNKVDGSLSGIEAAAESKNAGSNFEKVSGYLKTAKDLFDKGLVGTDDFQTVAKFIAKDSDSVESAVKNFSDNYKNIKKYFTTDDDGNLTKSGITTFASDVTKALDKTGGSFKSTSEAAAALGMSTEAFEAVLDRCGDYGITNFNEKIQDMYNNLPRSAKAFSDAKAGLSALEEVYNNFDANSSGRDAFGGMLDGWKKALAEADGDLSKFDPEITVQIKAALDLAQIQAELDELEALVKEGGGKDITANTAANAKRAQYISKSEANIGIGKSDKIEIPVVYKQADNALDELHKQLANAKSDKEVIEIQAKIANIQNIQKDILDAFMSAHPEVNFDANPEEATASFNAWVSSTEGQEVIAKITGDNEEALQAIADILDIDIEDLKVKVDADTSEASDNIGDVQEQANNLDGTTSVVELEAEDSASDTVEDTISAITGIPEDVVIELEAHDDLTETVIAASNYIENIPDSVVTDMMAQDNATDALKVLADYIQQCNTTTTTTTTTSGTETAVSNLSSVASAKSNANGNANVNVTSSGTAETSSELSSVKNEMDAISSASPTSAVKADTKTALFSLNAVKLFTIPNKSFTVSVINKASSVLSAIRSALSLLVSKTITITTRKVTTTEAAGTAHSSGSALSRGSIFNNKTGLSYLNGTRGDWRVGKDQDALINEVAPELIVDSKTGTWRIANNGMPGFTRLHANDIVFNGAQTRDLLERGKTSSYGKFIGALNSGSAYSSGSVGGKAFASGSNNNAVDWIEILLDRASRLIDQFTTRLENAFDSLENRLNAVSSAISATRQEYTKQQQAYNAYMAEANKVKLSASLKKQVREGATYTYSKYTDTEKEAIDKYKDLIDKAKDAAKAMEELKVSLAELYKQAFEIVQSRYDSEFDALKKYEQIIQNNIDLLEAQGYSANPEDYHTLINYMEREIAKYQSEYTALTAKLDAAVKSGSVKKWSEEWWDMYNTITDVAANIQEAQISLEEYQQTILDLKWDNFDYMEEQLSQITKETEFLIGLLENSDLYDDKGQFTNEGLAALSLYNDQYKAYIHQAEDYAKQIAELNALISEDPSNKNLVDRRNELIESQQDLINSAQEEKKAIKDLIEEAYDAQIESLEDIVSAYEESLDAAKDLNDYQKQVQENAKTIAALQKEIAALTGDNSDETRARLQQLQVDLSDAQKELEETQTDRLISEQKKLIDNFVDEYKEALFAGLDDIDTTLNSILSSIEDPQAINATIKDAAAEYGYAISDSMSEIIRFGNVESILNDISETVNKLFELAEYVKLNDNNDPVIDSNGNVSTGQDGSGVRSKVFGVADGGHVADIKKAAIRNGDNIITVNTLRKGESVLTPQQTQWFQEYADNMPALSKLIDIQSAVPLRNIQPAFNFDVNMTYAPQFNVGNVNDYNDIRDRLLNDRALPQAVRAMTVDMLNGGSSLAYKKYLN